MLNSAPRKRKKRRTQAERRRATSRALLDSAVACISEHGVAGATVQRIARRAGATTGAVQHLFGHRDGLLLGVVDDFGGKLDAVSDASLAERSTLRERVEAVVGAYWDLVSGDHFLAVLQIMLAARHDPQLYRQMFARMKGFEAELDRRWLRIFRGSGVEPQRIKAARHVALAALRGLSVRMVYRRDRTRWAAELRLLKDMVADALASRPTRSG